MLGAMRTLLDLFEPYFQDTETTTQLRRLIEIRSERSKGHALFQDIRQKTLRASREGDIKAETQYLFEEACAKTLFNFTFPDAPFDPDCPYWVAANAFALAKRLEIDPMRVVNVISGRASARN